MTVLALVLIIATAAVTARSFRRAHQTLTEAEQFQKARAATTPEDWRPL